MINVGLSLFLLQSFSVLKSCQGSIRHICQDEEKSLVIPYISDRNGEFISDFKNSLFSSYKHLYLSFKWRDGINTLELQRTTVSPPTASIVWQQDNITQASILHDPCSYQGKVIGVPESTAAVSIRENVNGYVLTNGYEFVIESLSDDFHRTGLHMLTSCRVNGNKIRIKPNNNRHRRQVQENYKYMEVLLAADQSVVKFIGKDKVEKYILTIMNIVNSIYKHNTLDSKIEVVISNIIVMDTSDEKAVFVQNDARTTVDRFCNWMARHPKYAISSSHDVAVMLTRNGIGPAGYAPITGMCNPVRSCAVIKDEGFTSAFIIAHEIAHVIGVYHDGHGNDCHGREFQYSMMASMVQSTLQHYWWSRCSNDAINKVLPYLTCLNNNPYKDSLKGVSEPIGQGFTLDDQCRFEFGENHLACTSYYGDLCETLWCAEKSNLRLCKTKRGRPLNGTPCSSGKYWCFDGKCVYHGHEKPRDGGWGNWEAWSACSTDCNVGIKQRSRRCNNPKPSYGGKQCEGDNKDVYTCSTGKECNEYTDVRALQCSVLNGIPIRGRSHTWLPYQKEEEKQQCKLTCISNDTKQIMTFDDMQLEDGTPCTYENPNNICVKGECWKVGCDGQMNSTVDVDACGVCRGNGSDCKVVKGVYDQKFEYKQWPPEYQRIFVIPANSRGIDIQEDKSTSHFLAIRDPAYGLYYLNGEGRASNSKKLVMNGAWFEYENKWNRETLKSPGPIRRALELMIMPQNKYQAAIVNYEYTVKKDDFTFEKSKYEWVFDYWTDCSVTCGTGTQHIVNKCVDKDTREPLDGAKCIYVGNGTGQPTKCERQACNAEVYTWAMELTWSACSATCGGGMQTQNYRCELNTPDGKYIPAQLSKCDQLSVPNFTRPCNDESCGSYEWESTDEWTLCPVTCGIEGFQFEIFHCMFVTKDGEKNISDEYLCNNQLKPNISRPCILKPCLEQWYQWGFNHEWTQCSESCGDNGVQYPIFFCEQTDSHGFSDIVNIRMCDNLYPPDNITKPCNRESCVLEWFQWHYGEWKECSVQCGNLGIQTRDYRCERAYSNSTTEVVNIYMCDDLEKPVHRKDCSGPPCKYSTFRLSYTSEWEECTTSCGEMGIQTQKSVCQEVMPNGTVADASIYMCDDLVSLSEIRPCNRFPCTKFAWTPAPFWTNCTAACGDDGLMYQMHYCEEVSPDGSTQFVHYEQCATIEMPFVTKECNRWPCIQEWNAGPWSECSVTCGQGTLYRNVFCADPSKTSDDYLCPESSPENISSCQMESCPLGDEEKCEDILHVCGRTASKRRCAYKGFKERCCASCARFQ